jgi:type IV secretion system protein VirD4
MKRAAYLFACFVTALLMASLTAEAQVKRPKRPTAEAAAMTTSAAPSATSMPKAPVAGDAAGSPDHAAVPVERPSPWKTRSIGLLLGLISGGLVGAFFSQRASGLRRYLVLGTLAVLAFGATTFALMWNDAATTMAGVVFGGVTAWLLLRVESGKRNTTLGSARWADLDELQESGIASPSRDPREAAASDSPSGLFLGYMGGKRGPHRLHYTGSRHALTIGPTGSHKGAAAIVPNLLSYAGSTIVIDPKGENARITALRRGPGTNAIPGMKQRVFILDPWNIARVPGIPAARFNPLDWVIADPVNAVENAMLLAEAIVAEQRSRDPYWDNEASGLGCGAILHVAFDPSEAGQRHLGRVRDIITSGEAELVKVLAKMVKSAIPAVRSTAERTIAKDEKLRASIFSTLQSHTHFLDSPVLRASLSASDFSFADMKKEAMTVYLVLPATKLNGFGRWLRILVQQAIIANATEIAAARGKRPVLFILDEMAALGRLAVLEQAYGLMAGFGIQLWGIFQDAAQAKSIYGDGWETFVGNAGVLQYFGSRDQTTAEYMSKLCGVTTMTKFSITSVLAKPFSFFRSQPEAEQRSMTQDIVQRQLAFADELMRLKHPQQLLFVEGSNPILANKLPWFDDPQRKALGVNLIGEAAAPAPPLPGASRARPVPPAFEVTQPPSLAQGQLAL